jgi:hypothetical protein
MNSCQILLIHGMDGDRSTSLTALLHHGRRPGRPTVREAREAKQKTKTTVRDE